MTEQKGRDWSGKKLLLCWVKIAKLRMRRWPGQRRAARMWSGQVQGTGEGPAKDRLLALGEQLSRQMVVLPTRRGRDCREWARHGLEVSGVGLHIHFYYCYHYYVKITFCKMLFYCCFYGILIKVSWDVGLWETSV